MYATSLAGEESLWVRHVATSSNVQIVPAAEANFTGPTFSRDGGYVYYTVEEKKQPVSTDQPAMIDRSNQYPQDIGTWLRPTAKL